MITEREFVYLIDFGLAGTAGEAGLTTAGSTLGTLAYMAPERFEGGQVDPRSDIYALTCVLYECLTGARPYPADSLEQQIAGHVMSPPPRPSASDPRLAAFDDVIAKGMAKKPAKRYQTAGDLAAAARRAHAAHRARTPARRRVSRRALLGTGAGLVLISVAAVGGVRQWRGLHLPPPPPPGRTAFFVSPSGNDANPGTLGQPWRTIDRALAQNYVAGDQLLFERGGEYFGKFAKTVTANGSYRWLIGAYGTGPKPIITIFKLLNNAGAWTQHSTNVWRINLTIPSTHGGWTGIPSGGPNIGFLRTGGTIYAVKTKTLAELANQWDFYTDSTYLYVRSTSNPAILAPDLRAAPDSGGDSAIISAHSNTEINGLELTGTGGHAIANALTSPSNIHVINNNIHDIGGSFLIGYRDNTIRYGNGVQILTGGSNWLVAGNEISECYDAGFTCQGENASIFNIHVTQNYVHHNSQNVEFWGRGSGSGFQNILMDDNDFEYGGYGWGALVRPDQSTHNRVQWNSYDWQLPADILATNNRIKRALQYRHSNPHPGVTPGVDGSADSGVGVHEQ